MAPVRNLFIDQGSTFSVTLELTDELDNILDLTDYSARSQIRKSYYTNTFVNFTVTITDPTSGEIKLSLSSTQTSALKAGRYVYDVEIVNEDTGEVIRVIEGIVTVNPEVTK